MVSGFFREDLGEVSILRQERDFGFCLFGGDGKFCCCYELGDEQRVQEKSFAIASKDSVDLMIVQRVLEILVLHIVVKIVIEVGVVDSVYVDMSVGAEKGFSKE